MQLDHQEPQDPSPIVMEPRHEPPVVSMTSLSLPAYSHCSSSSSSSSWPLVPSGECVSFYGSLFSDDMTVPRFSTESAPAAAVTLESGRDANALMDPLSVPVKAGTEDELEEHILAPLLAAFYYAQNQQQQLSTGPPVKDEDQQPRRKRKRTAAAGSQKESSLTSKRRQSACPQKVTENEQDSITTRTRTRPRAYEFVQYVPYDESSSRTTAKSKKRRGHAAKASLPSLRQRKPPSPYFNQELTEAIMEAREQKQMESQGVCPFEGFDSNNRQRSDKTTGAGAKGVVIDEIPHTHQLDQEETAPIHGNQTQEVERDQHESLALTIADGRELLSKANQLMAMAMNAHSVNMAEHRADTDPLVVDTHKGNKKLASTLIAMLMKGPATRAELSERMGVNRKRISTIFSILKGVGLVYRDDSVTDRQKKICLNMRQLGLLSHLKEFVELLSELKAMRVRLLQQLQQREGFRLPAMVTNALGHPVEQQESPSPIALRAEPQPSHIEPQQENEWQWEELRGSEPSCLHPHALSLEGLELEYAIGAIYDDLMRDVGPTEVCPASDFHEASRSQERKHGHESGPFLEQGEDSDLFCEETLLGDD